MHPQDVEIKLGWNEMERQPDGSYKYVPDTIGRSPIGRAKLVLREFIEKYDEKTIPNNRGLEKNFEEWADELAEHLHDVLLESDRRVYRSIKWYDHVFSWMLRRR